ncbi:MAG: DedA family protein [Candidatus Micrarchaeaceae archaeon]
MASNIGSISGLSSSLLSIITAHSYLGIFFLMLLESASLPVPSEVVLPAIGALAASKAIDLWFGLIAALAGSMAGIAVDYYIAYFIGKEIVYKHLEALRIKRSTLDAFDSWFSKNGSFAVFISRLIPVVRGLISFPAGFAEMPIWKFMIYSFFGTFIWDFALVLFGYYALATKSIAIEFAAVASFAIVLYLIYTYALSHIKTRKN